MCFGAGYVLSNIISTKQYSRDIAKYEARLDDLTKLNSGLKDENKRAAAYNRDITERLGDVQGQLDKVTGRLSKAKSIVDGLNGQATSDGDTIQRLVANVSKLERALSVIFTGK